MKIHGIEVAIPTANSSRWVKLTITVQKLKGLIVLKRNLVYQERGLDGNWTRIFISNDSVNNYVEDTLEHLGSSINWVRKFTKEDALLNHEKAVEFNKTLNGYVETIEVNLTPIPELVTND
jgi:hypothetical protein